MILLPKQTVVVVYVVVVVVMNCHLLSVVVVVVCVCLCVCVIDDLIVIMISGWRGVGRIYISDIILYSLYIDKCIYYYDCIFGFYYILLYIYILYIHTTIGGPRQ